MSTDLTFHDTVKITARATQPHGFASPWIEFTAFAADGSSIQVVFSSDRITADQMRRAATALNAALCAPKEPA